MSSQAAKLKKLMKTTIRDMARNQAQFTRTPGRDFTRKRKLDFASVVSILLSPAPYHFVDRSLLFLSSKLK